MLGNASVPQEGVRKGNQLSQLPWDSGKRVQSAKFSRVLEPVLISSQKQPRDRPLFRYAGFAQVRDELLARSSTKELQILTL